MYLYTLKENFSNMKTNYILDHIQTAVGKIPQVATKLSYKNHLGTLKVRWLIGRDNYKVEPGLFAVGNPTGLSNVFVTANYKLSFDHLRKNLVGLNAWILVLDTKGINVWCAAGKGTFGTKELINRIKLTKLDLIVTHRKLIVPQLGATGVSAHEVKEGTCNIQSGLVVASPTVQPDINSLNIEPSKINLNRGFNVIFRQVRASDIKSFIDNGYRSTNEMRKVTFNLLDRIKLTPVDFVYARYKLLAAFALVFIVSGLNRSGISFSQAIDKGFSAILNIFLAYLAGIVITPILLPYLPFKKFAFKGLVCGLILSAILYCLNKLGDNYFEISSWILIISGISSFMAMNFTGASTFTSLSGVKKEMKVAVPVQISFALVGLILLIISKVF